MLDDDIYGIRNTSPEVADDHLQDNAVADIRSIQDSVGTSRFETPGDG